MQAGLERLVCGVCKPWAEARAGAVQEAAAGHPQVGPQSKLFEPVMTFHILLHAVSAATLWSPLDFAFCCSLVLLCCLLSAMLHTFPIWQQSQLVRLSWSNQAQSLPHWLWVCAGSHLCNQVTYKGCISKSAQVYEYAQETCPDVHRELVLCQSSFRTGSSTLSWHTVPTQWPDLTCHMPNTDNVWACVCMLAVLEGW